MAALIDCNCNLPTCDCCINKPTTVQTDTTTLVTPAYFNDKSFSGLTNVELLATQNVVLDVAASLTLFNNNILNNAVFNKTEYTFVIDRLAQGAITQTEYREFLNEYGYTVDTATTTGTATTNILNNPKKHMEHFNNFLKETIAGVAVSSLCKFLSDPFNKITAATELFSDFLGGFKSLKDLIANLENPLDALSGLAASLKEFANSLIASIGDIVNSIKDKVTNLANKVSKEIAKIVGMQGPAKLSMNRWFAKQFANIQIALSEGNIANLVKNISTKIAEAVLGFATLTQEAIEFLLFLFCKMATSVENNLLSVLDGVTCAASKIAYVNSSLSIGSADALKAAVEAGRPVLDPGTLAAQYQDIINRSNAQASSSTESSSPRLIVPSNYSTHPDPGAWSNLTFSGQVLNPGINPKAADDTPFWTTYGELKVVEGTGAKDSNGKHILKIYTVNIKSLGIDPKIGYYGMDIHVLEMMNEVGRLMGRKLTCISAFRHLYYNSYLRDTKQGRLDAGVALYSQHSAGKAMDIAAYGNIGGDNLEFLQLCQQVGFVGFGYYPAKHFLHCDVASARDWNEEYRPKGWAPYPIKK